MGAADTETDVAAATDDVDALRRAIDEERQRSLRLRAEYDNLRRRGARQQEAAAREGRRARQARSTRP